MIMAIGPEGVDTGKHSFLNCYHLML